MPSMIHRIPLYDVPVSWGLVTEEELLQEMRRQVVASQQQGFKNPFVWQNLHTYIVCAVVAFVIAGFFGQDDSFSNLLPFAALAIVVGMTMF